VTGENIVILQPPETDAHIAIVDSQAPDAAGAVAAGWAAYKPDQKRPLKLVTAMPPREGWEEREVISYETSRTSALSLRPSRCARAMRGPFSLLRQASQLWRKRATQAELVLESLRPKGYERESFAGRKPEPLDDAHIAELTSFVQASMQELGIPGVSIGLIDRGRIVYEGGFGVRELGKPERVDENTLFMAASNTKGMTTLLLAELVDEKKVAMGSAGHPGLSEVQTWRFGKRRGKFSSRTWFVHARACPGRILNGYSISRIQRRNPSWRCSVPCSQRASLGRFFSTAI